MWTTCFAGTPCGAIDSTTAIGPFEGKVLVDPALLGELSLQGLEEGLPRIDAAAGEHPVLLARFLLADEEGPALAPENGRHPDSRLHHTVCDEPKPRTPRSLADSSSTSRTASSGTGQDDELGDPFARLGDERPLAVGVQEHDLDLAAVARVDQARRVDDRDPVPGSKARPRLDEACIPLGDRHGEPRADERSLPGPEPDLVAGGEVEAGIAVVGAVRHARVLAEALNLELDHRPRAFALAAGSATRYGAKRGTSRCGSWARTTTPSGVSSRSSIGAPSS